MENEKKRDDEQKPNNPPEQKLSYFERHLNKYPDGPKSMDKETVNEKKRIPDPDDEGDYEDTADNNIQAPNTDQNSPKDGPDDGRDQNITPDSNSYNPANSKKNKE